MQTEELKHQPLVTEVTSRQGTDEHCTSLSAVLLHFYHPAHAVLWPGGESIFAAPLKLLLKLLLKLRLSPSVMTQPSDTTRYKLFDWLRL